LSDICFWEIVRDREVGEVYCRLYGGWMTGEHCIQRCRERITVEEVHEILKSLRKVKS